MFELGETHYEILETFDGRRATPSLIRQECEFREQYDTQREFRDITKGYIHDLCRYGYVCKIVTGLYIITDKGERALEEWDDD